MSARENVTDALDAITDSGFAAAGALDALQGSANATEDALDALERGGEGTAEALGDVATSGVEAAGSLSLAEGRVDELGDEFSETAAEGSALAGVLSSLPAADVLAGSADTSVRAETNDASFMAARAAIESLPDSHTVDVAADVDRDSFSIPQLAGRTVPFAAGGLSAPSVSPDSQTVPFEAGGMELPNLSALQVPATDGGDELLALGGAGHVASEGLDAASESAIEASVASALAASEADEAGDSLLSSVPGGEAFAHTLSGVRDSAFAAVPGLTAAENAADEAGDEFSETAGEAAALQASMAGLGGSGVGAGFLGFHGSLASMAALLPIVLAGVGGLVAPLGAVASGGGAAGGALAAMFGAGLLSRGEELVGTLQRVDGELQRVTSSGEGAQVVLGRIKDRAGDIFSELQGAQTADFFSGIVGSGLTVLEDFVSFTNRQMDDLSAMGDRLGDAFAIEEPRAFAELEATTQAALPYLESAGYWLMGAIPDGLKWVREEGFETASMFADLGGSALSALVEFAELGGVVWRTLGPGLVFALNVGTGVLDVFNSLPGPVQEAAVVAVAAGAGFYFLSGALGAVSLSAVSLSGVLTAIAGTLSAIAWPVVAVGALAGAAYLAADHFGLLNSAVSVASGLWNGFLDLVSWTANSMLNLYDMAKPILMLIPGISSLVWLFDNWRAVVDVLGDALAWVVGKAKELIKWLDELSGFDEFVGKFIGKADDRGKGQAKVDLSGFKTGQGKTVAQDSKGGPGSGSGPDGPQGPQQPPSPGPGGYGGGPGSGYGGGQAGGTAAAAGGGGGTTINNTVQYYEQNGDSKSGPARERRVRNIVRQMNSEQRRSGTGMN